jgi:AcrR family transcriptional regulator
MTPVTQLVVHQAEGTSRVDGRTMRGQNTRERIINSARDLISTAGFHRSSLEDVARRSGVTRATVYQHFGSKRGLLEAVLSSAAPAAHGSTREREAVALAHPVSALRSLIGAQVRSWSANATMLQRVHSLTAVDPDAGPAAENDRARRVELAIIVVGLAERNHLRPGCTRREAFEALWMITGFGCFENLHLRSRLDIAEVENTLLALAGGIVQWDGNTPAGGAA